MSVKLTLFQVNSIKQWAAHNPDEFKAIQREVEDDIRFTTTSDRTRELYERAYKRMQEQERVQSKTLTKSETLELNRLLAKLAETVYHTDLPYDKSLTDIESVMRMVTHLIETGE